MLLGKDKRYIFTVILAVFSLLAIVMVCNFVVDPYGMFQKFSIKGFNIYKPAIYNRVRLLKAYEVRRVKPQSIILGSSTCHLAFQTNHQEWKKQAAHRYNLAFDGATTKEMYLYLIHTQAISPLKQVLLGLDDYHPTGAPGSVRPSFDPSILFGQNKYVNYLQRLFTDFKLLISFDTFKNSIETVRSQNNNDPIWFIPDGQRIGELFFRQVAEGFQELGPRHYFDTIGKQEVKYKLEWAIPQSEQKQSTLPLQKENDPISSLGYIKKIMTFCRDHDIDLHLFFTPFHAYQLEISGAIGDWNFTENTKRNLVEIIAEEAQGNPHELPFPLYDFTGYSQITTDPLPPVGSKDELTYYWDPSHFKESVGDMILDRIFGVTDKQNTISDDFGVLLTTQNLEGKLSDIREKQKNYRIEHPHDIIRIKKWVDDFRKKHGISLP